MKLVYNLTMNNDFLNKASQGGGSMIMSEKQEQLARINQQRTNDRNNKIKKILMIVIPVFLVLIVGVVIFSLLPKQKELACTSEQGSITLKYNTVELTHYTADNIEFDLPGQNKLVKRKGIDTYLSEFENWFRENTGQNCVRK